MQWISECDARNGMLMHHVLVLSSDRPIESAYAEFWKRMLSDGCAHAETSGWTSLGAEIFERQSAMGGQGFMHVKFRDGQRKPCRGVSQYFLRSEAFTCLDVRGEDRMAARRRQLRFFLEHYTLLKQATASPQVRPLLERIGGIRPLTVDAAAGYGWFDLQIGQESFGPLPAEDQAMLQMRSAA
jgi:hypothetical protein